MAKADANKATSRSENAPKPQPLTEAEQFYVNEHPYTPLAEIARVLGRDEASLAGIVPERTPQFERLLEPIIDKRVNRTVGTVWTPQAAAAMDEHRKHNREQPASAAEPADKTKCNHSPMGDRRKAPAIKLGRPVSDIGKDAPKPTEQPAETLPPITQPAPEQAAATPPRKAGAYTMGGKPQSINDRRQ
jgi:hypothetical protein